MTLTVATPAVAGIKTYGNGIKVVRLHEYAGALRSTLSIVDDPDSPVGRAVKDTQELAPATSNSGRGASVSDTVSIPISDLDIGPDDSYTAVMGFKVVGRPPIGARASETWNSQALAPGPAVCRVHDSTVFSYFPIPREFYAGYTLVALGSFSPFFFGSATQVSFRAWGITGGNMEFYLDVLYMIPNFLADDDQGGGIGADQFMPLFLDSGFLGPNEDNNTSNSIGTAHSVMPDRYYDSVWSDDVIYDLQDARDEKSLVDWNNIFFEDPTHENSFIYFVAGSRYLDAHTILTEDFSDWPGEFPLSQYDEVDQGYVIETATSNFQGLNLNPVHDPPGPGVGWGPEWYLMNESVQFLGPDATSGIGVLPVDPPGAGASWSIGAMTGRAHPVSGAGSADPRNIAPLLQGYDSIIQLYKVNLLMSHTGADVEMHFGGARWSAINTAHQTRYTVTAKVIHHDDGTHAIALEAYLSNGSVYEEFASPVTVMGSLSPGDSYWVRVEKRYNHWRARCWIDGDTEPSSWDVEGFAPAAVRSSGVEMLIDHPYNDNWPATIDFTYEDPRYWHGNPFFGSDYTPWLHESKIWCGEGFDTSNYEIQVEEVTLTYDPNGFDGSGEHTGAYINMEKYDGSEDWGTVYLAPRSWRLVYSEYAAHHFDNDTHGGNMYAWKEEGASALQVAAWEIIRFRRPAALPLWGDITHP